MIAIKTLNIIKNDLPSIDWKLSTEQMEDFSILPVSSPKTRHLWFPSDDSVAGILKKTSAEYPDCIKANLYGATSKLKEIVQLFMWVCLGQQRCRKYSTEWIINEETILHFVQLLQVGI